MPENSPGRLRSDWHLDKRVPLAIVGALLIQTITVVYVAAEWKASTDARIRVIEVALRDGADTDVRQWQRLQSITDQQETLNARLAGLDERTKSIQAQTDRILNLLLQQQRGRE